MTLSARNYGNIPVHLLYTWIFTAKPSWEMQLSV